MATAAFTFVVVLLGLGIHADRKQACTIQHVPFTYADGTVRDMILTVCPPKKK